MPVKWTDRPASVPGMIIDSPDRLWIYITSCQVCPVANFQRDSPPIFSNWLLPTHQIIPARNATDMLAQHFVANDEFPHAECICTVQYGTVQYNTVRYSTIQYSTVQ
jgi:hypothetical protein